MAIDVWDYQQLVQGSQSTILDFDFTKSLLALDLTFGNKRSTWYQAGYVIPLVNIDGDFFEDKAIKLRFDKQILEIPYLGYRLRFELVDWAQNINIRIKQLPSTDYKPMTVSYPNSLPAVGPAVVATIVATNANSIILPANANRSPQGLIVNNATKNLWVTFTGVAATVMSPSIKIPANGGTMDIPGNYSGSINGLWESGATGSCVINEFSYT